MTLAAKGKVTPRQLFDSRKAGRKRIVISFIDPENICYCFQSKETSSLRLQNGEMTNRPSQLTQEIRLKRDLQKSLIHHVRQSTSPERNILLIGGLKNCKAFIRYRYQTL